MQAVNTVLIELYWQIGEVISHRVAAAHWGEGTFDQLASYIARWEPCIRERIFFWLNLDQKGSTASTILGRTTIDISIVN